ncbi:hypothetical protein L596_027037 [Steinernema carpocapsae]|uniref:Uncharacterized protein n=1 Tax=Steinernema carpocapsae TaxID=34508 RepID=A0A4U5M353_STECR|nr:hypothetical protein L596_027037 [Steinernema carpocapsae]
MAQNSQIKGRRHQPANARSPEAAPAEGSPLDAGIRRRVLPEQTSAALRLPRHHRLRVHLRGRSRRFRDNRVPGRARRHSSEENCVPIPHLRASQGESGAQRILRRTHGRHASGRGQGAALLRSRPQIPPLAFQPVYPSGQHDFGGLMKSYAIVTDGPWDLGKFFQLECIRSERYNAKIPHHFRAYINIRRVFTLKYKKTHALSKVNLGMLAVLGMEFEGREHCGLDDAMNLARIAIRMMEDGAEFRINEKLVAAEYADKYASFVPTISTTGMSTAERDRRKWRLNLPYRIVNICKDRFMTGAYADRLV